MNEQLDTMVDMIKNNLAIIETQGKSIEQQYRMIEALTAIVESLDKMHDRNVERITLLEEKVRCLNGVM